jgi:hypothetical protein
MPAAIPIAIGVSAAAGAGTAIYSAKKASSAAEKAAATQENAAKYAADLEYKASQEALAQQQKALDEEKRQFDIQQENLAPWMDAGEQSLASMLIKLGIGDNPEAEGFGQFNEKYTGGFTPGTYTWDPANNPAYQFQLKQGEESLARSAAAAGMPFGGTAAKKIMEYGQNYANQAYNADYQRWLQGQQLELAAEQQKYYEFENSKNAEFNRLAAIAGIGQAATQQANQSSMNYANAVQNNANTSSNIITSSADKQGDLITQAANARASGYIGSANAWNPFYQSVNQIAQMPYQYLTLKQILNPVQQGPYHI